MRTEQLNYCLPPELIAQQPCAIRSGSRLLVYDRSKDILLDSRFGRIGDFLLSGDCLVLNDTKVLPARFFARRRSGGKLEGLLIAERQRGYWVVYLKGARRVKNHERFYLKSRQGDDFCPAVLLEKLEQGRCLLKVETDAPAETILNRIGFPPLPPYIKRTDNLSRAEADQLRYQTVYARKPGAVAAPTAGLHFTCELLEQLEQAGISFAYTTLHVAEATFRPINVSNLEEHEIHEERFTIDRENARLINAAKEKGGRIIAVGTTSVRALETAAVGSRIRPAGGTTRLFITPGYEFRIVDAMVTNFHLPKSTLLALVAAFAGLENILAAYRHAIEQRYRFYSYGDAMLVI